MCETFLNASSVKAQWRNLDWQEDKWNSKNAVTFLKYDKLEHLIGSIILTIGSEQISEKHGWKYALLAGTLWEIKDALIPYEKYGIWGGEGFSFKDLLTDIDGIAISHYGRKFVKKLF